MRTHSLLLVTLLASAGASACARSGGDPARDTIAAGRDSTADSLAGATGDGDRSPSPPPQPPPPAPPASGDAFAAELLGRHLASTPGGGNVLLSPTSLALALRLVTEGAAGPTRDALTTMLGFPAATETAMRDASRDRIARLRGQRDVTLSIGTALWADDGWPLARAFVDDARRSYDAEAASLDLASEEAVRRINAWASRSTNGRIERVMEKPAEPDVGLILTNAVYFKGRWLDEFRPEATRDKPFARPGGAVTVKMMARTDALAYREADGVRIARLPYRGNRFAMYVLLPDAKHGVDDAVRALTPATMRAAAAAPRRELAVELPKFTLRYSTQLESTLTSMGAGIAFGNRADLSRLFDPKPPGARIDWVRQDVFVEVNEEGTEAAAVTSIGVVPTSAPPPPLPFVVDRPFVFAIRDDASGELLFVGRIVDPAAR